MLCLHLGVLADPDGGVNAGKAVLRGGPIRRPGSAWPPVHRAHRGGGLPGGDRAAGPGGWPNRPTTSCTGPSSTGAVTSRPWRSLTCWSGTCGSSSGWSGEAHRAGAQPGHAGPPATAGACLPERRRRGTAGGGAAGTAARLPLCRAVEPAGRLRPSRTRRRVRRPAGGPGAAHADHDARGARGGPPSLPGGDGSDAACLPAGRSPLHLVRAHLGRGRRAHRRIAGLRRPTAGERGMRGLARGPAGRAHAAPGVADAPAVRAAVVRAHGRAVVVRHPGPMSRRVPGRC